MMRVCTLCFEEKGLEDGFYRSKQQTGGRTTWCKACIIARSKKAYQVDPERTKARAREWAAKNPAAHKRYYKKEAAVARAKRWALLNPEKRKEIVRSWAKRNPESTSHKHALRRTRLIENGGYIPLKEWGALLEIFAHNCLYCGSHPSKLVIDHFVPVARGGRTEPGNLIPCCRACNARKSAKMPDIWMAEIGPDPDDPADGVCTVQRFLRASRHAFCNEITIQADDFMTFPRMRMPVTWLDQGFEPLPNFIVEI